MIISYPIFVRDRDGYMSLIKNEREVNVYLEEIDILEEEYSCWNNLGKIIKLTMLDNGSITAEYTGIRDVFGLEDALVYFSNKYMNLLIGKEYFKSNDYVSIFSASKKSDSRF